MLNRDTDVSDNDMFEIVNDPVTKRHIRVETRPHHGTHGKTWVVADIRSNRKFLLNRDGQWEFEPILAADDDFRARTRWDDAETAIEAAKAAVKAETVEHQQLATAAD